MKTNLREALLQLIAESKPIQVMAGTVKSVDQTNYTCVVSPIDGSPDYHAVRLHAAVDSQETGIHVMPKKNSFVLIGCLQDIDHSRFVFMYSQVDKVKITCDDIELNGGQFLGLAKVQELYNAISRLETAMQNHKHFYVDGPGVGISLTAQHPSQIITPPTTLNQLKNDKVKHG